MKRNSQYALYKGEKLVVAIENYQIKKYGCTLGNGSMDKNSRPERIRKL